MDKKIYNIGDNIIWEGNELPILSIRNGIVHCSNWRMYHDIPLEEFRKQYGYFSKKTLREQAKRDRKDKKYLKKQENKGKPDKTFKTLKIIGRTLDVFAWCLAIRAIILKSDLQTLIILGFMALCFLSFMIWRNK